MTPLESDVELIDAGRFNDVNTVIGKLISTITGKQSDYLVYVNNTVMLLCFFGNQRIEPDDTFSNRPTSMVDGFPRIPDIAYKGFTRSIQ